MKKPAETLPERAVGVWFAIRQGPAERPETVDAYVAALLSPAWRQPLRYLITQTVPGRPIPRRAGSLRTGEREAVLRELLVHPDLTDVTLATSEKTVGEYATLTVGTRRYLDFDQVRVYGRHALTPESTSELDAWVGAMLRLADEVRACHGVVFVMSDLGAAAEASLGGRRREGVEQHPFPDQLSRLKRAAPELGTRYARFPRWGTLLSHEHLGRIGGIDAVVSAAQPAVIRDVSEGVYVQLTESVATATSDESVAKQARLIELLAPILPPAADG